MKELLGALHALLLLSPSSAAECPPDVDKFLTLNGEPFKSSSPAVVRVGGQKEGGVRVATLGLRANKCYSSLECRLLQGGNILAVRRLSVKFELNGEECLLSLRSGAGVGRAGGGTAVSVRLSSKISEGLAPNCSSVISSSVTSFTLEFCSPSSGDNCYSGRVHYIETNFTNIGDNVILQRERKLSSGAGGDGICAKSGSLQGVSSPSSLSLTWGLLAAWIAAVLLATLAVLSCCWYKGCLGNNKTPSESEEFFPGNSFTSFNQNNSIDQSSMENSFNSRHELMVDKKSVGTSPPPLMTLESVTSYEIPSPSSPLHEEIPVRETKASIARKRKISEMNPKDPVHCHYQRNKENQDDQDNDTSSDF